MTWQPHTQSGPYTVEVLAYIDLHPVLSVPLSKRYLHMVFIRGSVALSFGAESGENL